MKVPDYATLKELSRVHKRFLDHQVEATLSAVPKLLDVVEDVKLTPDDKVKKLQQILTAEKTKEDEVGNKVKEVIAKAKTEFKIK